MASLSGIMPGSNLKRRIALALAAGLAGSLLLGQSSIAQADGPFSGTTGQQQWNWRRNPWWSQRPDHDRDHDFRDSRGWWDRDGLWRSSSWYGYAPVFYTSDRPVWDPHLR